MSKLIFDASIRKWRPQTQADIEWSKAVVQAVKALEGKL